MEGIKILFTTSRSIVFQLLDEGAYYETAEYELIVDGKAVLMSKKTVETLDGLAPDTEYTLSVRRGDTCSSPVAVRTKYEFVTLNVRDFGAHGDGVTDDTGYLQTAILVCPADSRVLVPKGV